MSTQSDFVQVELSAAGVEFAGKGGIVRITAAHFDYTFSAGKPSVRVLTSEWSRSLSKRAWQGNPILQIAQPVPATPSAPSVASTATVQVQEKGK